MHACMHACMYACMYVCMYVCVPLSASVSASVSVSVSASVSVSVSVFASLLLHELSLLARTCKQVPQDLQALLAGPASCRPYTRLSAHTAGGPSQELPRLATPMASRKACCRALQALQGLACPQGMRQQSGGSRGMPPGPVLMFHPGFNAVTSSGDHFFISCGISQ